MLPRPPPLQEKTKRVVKYKVGWLLRLHDASSQLPARLRASEQADAQRLRRGLPAGYSPLSPSLSPSSLSLSPGGAPPAAASSRPVPAPHLGP